MGLVLVVLVCSVRWNTAVIFNLVILGIAAFLDGQIDQSLLTTVPDSDLLGPLDRKSIPKCVPGEGLESCVTLAYAPSGNTEVDDLVSSLAAANDPPLTMGTDVVAYADGTVLNAELLANPNTTMAALLFFENSTGGIPDPFAMINSTGPLSYTVQLNFTQALCSSGGLSTICRDLGRDIVLPLQLAVEKAVMETRLGVPVELEHSTHEFPHPPLLNPENQQLVVPMFLFTASTFIFTIFLTQVVTERENGMKNYLRTTGTGDAAYWTSWLVYHTVFVAISVLIMIYSGIALDLGVFTDNSFAVLFALLFAYEMAMTTLAYALSPIFSSTRSASGVGFMIWITFLIANLFVTATFATDDPDTITIEQTGNFILLPPSLFQKAMNDLVEATVAGEGNGITWDEFSTNKKVWPISEVVGYLIFNVFFYLVLALYLDQVLESKGGKKRSKTFCLSSAYWSGGKSTNHTEELPVPWHPDEKIDEDAAREAKRAYDAEPAEYPVVVQNLTRVFPIPGIPRFFKPKWFKPMVKKDPFVFSHVACKNISFAVGKNELFGLLGPNGAGKSTAINMMIAAMEPSGGDAMIGGGSIVSSPDAVRGKIGVCPQFDIQFDQLTGKEHLEFFCSLKGVASDQIDAEVKAKLEDVDLWEARDRLAGTYSGGMRRRLSVAIALCGDPAVVFLDEPTTGMDPSTRRGVWSLFERAKKERTIILTTHSMEEADILADRIGIVAYGKMAAIGDSVHLKNRFGAGYRLNVSLDEKNGGGAEEVLSVVQTVIPSAVQGQYTDSVSSINVPPEATRDLPAAFDALDECKAVASYSVNFSSLEDVFTRLASDARIEHQKNEEFTLLAKRYFAGDTAGVEWTDDGPVRSQQAPPLPSPPTPRK